MSKIDRDLWPGVDGAFVTGAIAEQSDQVMRNLARVLELVGGAPQDVVAWRAEGWPG